MSVCPVVPSYIYLCPINIGKNVRNFRFQQSTKIIFAFLSSATLLWENDGEAIKKFCTAADSHLNVDVDPVSFGGKVEVDVAVEEGDVVLGQVPSAQTEHPGHCVHVVHHLLRRVGAELMESEISFDYGKLLIKQILYICV